LEQFLQARFDFFMIGINVHNTQQEDGICRRKASQKPRESSQGGITERPVPDVDIGDVNNARLVSLHFLEQLYNGGFG
jgi:hypothetical protein